MLTFGFDEFNTYLGPGFAATDKTKSCLIPAKLSYPRGYTFEVVDATYHGFARLDVGMTASMRSLYTITGDAGVDGAVNTTVAIVGPLAGVYTKASVVAEGSRLATDCGLDAAWLQVNTRVATLSSVALPSGSINDGPVLSLGYQQIQLKWTLC